ncbi:MAG: 2-oxoacid:acceptor oxidoreductase subunit alpha [Deltaproteobacteria bacterium]|nr:2-oxoacid:acceptor oxidoreductase subunit alpha [Deltaproteobacteria bacterium]MBW1919674.1 2-oxoacid:acceptor oxidoreductase subunit alpha [Deltaproteobacteria bacterium]MBW1936212.1 2-oxoacid:acceptor oxidoreductase subunit alpha [Deltaproteobacteria bacterium]MBW1978044.1 2-oxoacid:acceptor oxidoreductase subunit alpha [Deltaproteobacteria bacterium]MBW2045312.1 2-oxoacid:acceptor oxidoreductase subunit alpha [Deltaproteobacteria bacterium]
MSKKTLFLQGNEACVEGALYAGLDFFAGYPITPSTEIAEMLSMRLPKKGGKFIQMEDEIASMCAIIGASLTGHKSMTATSGPGFSLKQEAIGYAVMAEVPCVVVDVQRGGPSTGMPTKVSQGDVMQTRWGTHGDHAIITLTASNHQDLFAITVEAFNLSETYRTPVILLLDEVIAHMREKLVIPEKGEIPLVERLWTSVKEGTDYHPYLPREDGRLPMSDFGGVHRYNVTGLVHDMWGFPSEDPRIAYGLMRHLVDKIEGHVKEMTHVKEYYLDDADVVLISYGSSARSALHLVENRRARGERLGLLELQTLWPFPAEAVRKSCERAEYVIVVEMNMGQVTEEVRKVVHDHETVFLANRIDGTFISPTDIRNILRVVQGKGV